MSPDTCNKKSLWLSEGGFSLVEMIVVMAIFMVIIIISSEAFNKIVSVSTLQTKSSESDTQGIIGLEMLRIDLEHAGYGLPWLLNFTADFDEVQASVGLMAPGIDSEQFNDIHNSTETNKTPRAIQAAASTTDGRDYIAIKSILAGMNDTVKRWTYVEGFGITSALKVWGVNNFVTNEKVITIDSRTKRLVSGTNHTPATNFFYAIPNTTPQVPPDTPVDFRPQNDLDVYVVYGVADKDTASLRAPYNRVDYFVKRPTTASDIPTRCAPGTGILYKGVMKHANGALNPPYPLLECVADMQVVFSLDTNGDGGVDAHVPENGLLGLTAKQIRDQLKEVRVYIAAHEGGKDTSFQYPSPTLVVGEYSAGRTLDLNAVVGSEYKNYRWKVYKLVVTPRNINY